MSNPWEEVSLNDYENHMSLDSVKQLQTMNSIMKEQFEDYPVSTAMVLGVAGGNGLEHVSRDKYRTVYGVDINEDYIQIVSERYAHLSDILKCLKIDLICDADQLPGAQLLIANLLIEYIGYDVFQRVGYKIFRDDGNRYLMKKDEIHIAEERITAEEYVDFLKRTDLGSQYPKERFEERIRKLVKNVSISLIARNDEGLIVGTLFGLTDFCYWLYVTDLGVDRNYERQGIASRLMKTAHEIAGGEKDIAVYLIANEDAVGFYEKIGMKRADDVMKYNHIEWTEWTI
ncbi:bifunctional class I SAM-dependent methyltransferase/N-acetyltransferase [Oribacterium sp. FC2011]|uniref:bifunctional class I SAM-dependent methyltransferase/N-acetyltransferase n=1 Tax=Oribacterium sp. FC2011 TaxID=1408311 RepID=UPI000B21F938|nr:GNAT family N-acetyltransferase [Oribacterium sp. FC2011]